MSDRAPWFLQLLIRLFPAEFRHKHADDMAQVFRDRRRECGSFAAWLEAAPDLVRSAVVERWRDLVRLSHGTHVGALFHLFEIVHRVREIHASSADTRSPFPSGFKLPFFFARYGAAYAGSSEIGLEHLVMGLLRADPALARSWFGERERALIDRVVEHNRSRAHVGALKPGSLDLPLSDECERIVEQATAQALLGGKGEPELVDLFRTIAQQP